MIKSIVLGGGCFWCTEAIFQRVKGVTKVVSGYSGGEVPNPTDDLIYRGDTNHAEVIKVEYEDSEISLEDIFEIFLKIHDPTTLNQQGYDVGTQYRSIIFANDETEIDIAKKAITQVENEKIYTDPIITEVELLNKFYEAEDYHKDFYNKNPNQGYCKAIIDPKVRKFMQNFKDKAKQI